MYKTTWLECLILGASLVAALLCTGAQTAKAADKKPAVLFPGGFHREYFSLPLIAEGIELHSCDPADLPERLSTGRYNVVVVTSALGNEKVVAALKAFMAEGGGVFVTYGHTWPDESEWKARQTFLEERGAHYVWVDVKEREPKNIVSSFRLQLSYTENIAAPFNKGVTGLLYQCIMHVQGTPSTPLVVDKEWTAAVRGSDTTEAVPFTEEKNPLMRGYVPEETVKAPVLLAVRKVGPGRLAAFAMSPEWIFWSPTNCPPVEAMMTKGAGGRPSNWIRVFANTFRWLAEPTLAAGKGGEPTPASILADPKDLPGPPAKLRDWTQASPIEDQGQLPGLVGARSSYSGGKGTVEEWVAAAKTAGLKFLVFLEPLEHISREDYAKLQADCAKYTDDTFFACPGLSYKDVHTKTNTFAYGEEVQFPLPELLTEDGKYLDNSKKVGYRSRHLFDYVLEQQGYRGQFGFFRHVENKVPPWEYKMYSVFTAYSTENGKPVDNNFQDLADLQAMRMNLTPGALSIMHDPGQIGPAVEEDWLVINTSAGTFSDGTYSVEYGKGIAAIRKLYKTLIAWFPPFQYITQGPRILCWRGRWPVVLPRGQWFRPDLARYRARLHVTSDVGIKEIKLMSMGRVLKRFLPNGAKEFDRSMEFENSQQRAIYPIIEDIEGKKAIGMIVRNTTTLWTAFICGDRCNHLNYGYSRTIDGHLRQFQDGSGNSVTHNKGGWMHVGASPAATLTVDYPTLPIDGAPKGDKTTVIRFLPFLATPGFPGSRMFETHSEPILASPDVFIGGGSLNYMATDETGLGDAWSWFSPVKRNEWLGGGGRNTLFHPLINGMRSGWYEFRLIARKDMPVDKDLSVRFTQMPFVAMRDGQGRVWLAGAEDIPRQGSFRKGAYALMDDPGGPTGIVSLDDNLYYKISGKEIQIGLRFEDGHIPKGTPLNMKLGYMGAAASKDISDLRKYINAMSAPLPKIEVQTGKLTLMDCVAMHFDGEGKGIEMRISPMGLDTRLPVLVENMHPNWDVWLLDRARKLPNWRQLPKLETIAYAAILSEESQDVFIGHPVAADSDDVRISLCNLLPGEWLITLHNPTDEEIKTTVRSAPQWEPFKLPEKPYTIPPGSSVDIAIRAAK